MSIIVPIIPRRPVTLGDITLWPSVMVQSRIGIPARRFLIVEDEFLIAIMLEDMLCELGHKVVGMAHTADIAKKFIRLNPDAFDAATLDINLGGAHSDEVATALDVLGIPFIITTGYDGAHFPKYRSRAFVGKPLVLAQLRRAVEMLQTRQVEFN